MLALRPERLRIGGPLGANGVDGVVTDRTYSGDAMSVTVRLADGSTLRVKRALADGLGGDCVDIGAAVRVGWQPEACMLLPP